MASIFSRVESYYNKKINIEGEKLPSTLISGKLVLTENIDDVMICLVKTLEGGFEKNEDGSFLIKDTNKQ